jgi:hypothetical protein
VESPVAKYLEVNCSKKKFTRKPSRKTFGRKIFQIKELKPVVGIKG